MQPQLTIVTVTIEDREDGGLRVHSDDLPGLILSGSRKEEVVRKIVPAIQALFEFKGFGQVTVRPAKPVYEILKLASPRDIDVHVQHEQFVVEMQAAA